MIGRNRFPCIIAAVKHDSTPSPPAVATPGTTNVGGRLAAIARDMPDQVAVVEPLGYDREGKRAISPSDLS